MPSHSRHNRRYNSYDQALIDTHGRKDKIRLNANDENYHRDQKLTRAINCRVIKNQAPHRFHLKRHEIRVAVTESLRKLQNDRDLVDFSIDNFIPIKIDQCLMSPNTIAPDNDLKSPLIRNFWYVDFIIKFKSNEWQDSDMNRVESFFKKSDKEIIEFFENRFYKYFVEKMAEYYGNFMLQSDSDSNRFLVLTDPDKNADKLYNTFGKSTDFNDKNEPIDSDNKKLLDDIIDRRTNTFVVITKESREKLKHRNLGIYRANACTPDGVILAHFDKWMWFDEQLKNSCGFDAFGIRLWPCKDEIVASSTIPKSIFDECTQKAQDEVFRVKFIEENNHINQSIHTLYQDQHNSFAMDDDYHCRRGRWALLSKFIVTWKWLRHQYNDWLCCMSDWFIFILGYHICFNPKNEELRDIKNDRIDMKNYSISVSKAFKESIELLAGQGTSIFTRSGKSIMLDPVIYYDKENNPEPYYRNILDEFKNCKISKSNIGKMRHFCNILKNLLDNSRKYKHESVEFDIEQIGPIQKVRRPSRACCPHVDDGTRRFDSDTTSCRRLHFCIGPLI